MATKLTLTLNDKVIESAKKYSRKNNISLSKLVEIYFRSISKPDKNNIFENIPPITKELSGIAKIEGNIPSDKELLKEALNKKFLE